jgi:hypothetical protein
MGLNTDAFGAFGSGMKTTFVFAVLLGLGLVVAGAHFVPWVAHARLPSQTHVLATGGRTEQFLIRLPADRIAATGAAASGVRALPAAALALPAELADQPLLVEHFKIRDAAGNVIGIAARHWSADSRGHGTAWSLLIPSRGALLLTAPGEARGALDAALQKAGYRSGSAWNGNVAVRLTPGGDDGGALTAGSDEFEHLDGDYAEIWTVTGVSDAGELRGTIELNTVTRVGS